MQTLLETTRPVSHEAGKFESWEVHRERFGRDERDVFDIANSDVEDHLALLWREVMHQKLSELLCRHHGTLRRMHSRSL